VTTGSDWLSRPVSTMDDTRYLWKYSCVRPIEPSGSQYTGKHRRVFDSAAAGRFDVVQSTGV